MRKDFLAFCIFLMSVCAAPAQMMQDIVNGEPEPSTATYTGPGDVVSGASAWYGLRAYNAAYASPGTNLAVNLRRTSDNATCNFVIATSGEFGGTASACAQGGGLSLASFATQDATCTGTISSTTLTCASASSTPHAGSTLTGTGITQPSFIVSCGTFTGGAGTCTLNAAQTVSVGETITMTYGLYVAEVYDQSGANFCSSAPCHVVQATAGSQPQLLPSCIGTSLLPCINPIGSKFLVGTVSVTDSFVSRTSVYNFSSLLSTPAQTIIQTIGTNTTACGLGGGQTSGDINVQAAGSFTNIAASAATFYAIIGITVGSGSNSININGSSTTGTATACTNSGDVALFSTSNGNRSASGYWGESGDWTATFNGTQISNMTSNQRTYWGF